LDRLERQARVFARHIPEFWLAVAPKWKECSGVSFSRNAVIVDLEDPHPVKYYGHRYGYVDRCITVQMLDILWRAELNNIATRKRLYQGRRGTMTFLSELIARACTGKEIVEEVCRELRAREARWIADPAIPL